MKIGILTRNPKLYSSQSLHKAIERKGHTPIFIDHAKCSMEMQKGSPNVVYQGDFVEKVDAIIPRIGSSITFYGTAVVRQFEMMDVFTTAGSQAILRSRDKLRSLQILSSAGLAIPKTVFAKFPKGEEVDELIRQVGGTPVIVKLLEGTQGVGVILAETPKSAKSLIEAFSGNETNILIQEYIKESSGIDIRVLVVDGEVVGAMERKGAEGEFRSNLHRGGTGTIIELSKKEQSAAIKAAKALGLSFAGVDILRSKRGPLIVEVNSSPGLEGIETVTGIDIAGKLVDYIERDVKKVRRNRLAKS